MAKKEKLSLSEQNLLIGDEIVEKHPLFGNIAGITRIYGRKELGKDCAAIVKSSGYIHVNRDTLLSPNEWAYVIAHCKLHLSFGHFDYANLPGFEVLSSKGSPTWKASYQKKLWNMACDIYIAKFLSDIKFGVSICPNPIQEFSGSLSDERAIYSYLLEHGYANKDNVYGTSTVSSMDMIGLDCPFTYEENEVNEDTTQFAYALAWSASHVVGEAGGHKILDIDEKRIPSVQAAQWFINHYPLLGALATNFKIIEDISLCQKHEIQVAAINVADAEIYVNPVAHLNTEELKFVLAHEFLHAGLQHYERREGRDAYLWNIACDYVINDWLVDMKVGQIPEIGMLYDATLSGKSAESIYDIILGDLKKLKKYNTFCGYGKGDILIDTPKQHSSKGSIIKNGMTLDELYRSALMQGLEYHQTSHRGYLPAGLIEEIRALAMPSIPWDVKLARWFDLHFPAIEKMRTYARPSRRQASTPSIPRPNYVKNEICSDARTFGVVVDTSGSMTSKMLGMALGSIASYAAAKEVPFARVIFCDAYPYDAGYLAPEDIAGRVSIKGRGGTILQPGIDLLEKATDFPKNGPILIITDGWIEDHLTIKRNHAYLLPKGHFLPFRARGEVFYFSS